MLKNEIKYAYDEYLKLKTEYNQLVDKIKAELKSVYPSFDDVNVFRRAFSLVSGKYQKYESAIWGSGYSLSSARAWKSNEYLHYYNLYKVINRSGRYIDTETVLIGIVCYKSNFIRSNTNYNKKLWIEYCKRKDSYTKSLEEFLNDCSKNEIDYFDILSRYLVDKGIKFELEIINEPKLKIKDVVVFYLTNSKF